MNRLDEIEKTWNSDDWRDVVKDVEWLIGKLRASIPFIENQIEVMEFMQSGYGESAHRQESITEAKDLLKSIQEGE